MVPVLNECGTHCAVFGNHDFGKIASPLLTRSWVCMVFMYFYNIFLLGLFVNVNPWSDPKFNKHITNFEILGM